MSKSIQRNEIIALDGFNFNPQRDTFPTDDKTTYKRPLGKWV